MHTSASTLRSESDLPPGPRGHLLFGSIPELSRDWLKYLAACEREYGPIVRLRMPWPVNEIILLTDPELIERVFVNKSNEFQKPFSSRLLEPIFGKGLFLAEGEEWRRQRRMLQPAFHRECITAYVQDMVETTGSLLEEWRREGKSLERDVYQDTLKLTFRITAKTMFGAHLDADADRASQALTDAMRAFSKLYNSRLPLPHFVPTRRSLNLRRAANRLAHVVDELIAERTARGAAHADLLTLLMETRYEDGTPLTLREVRDQAMTAFAAGSETSAVAAAWTLHLLSEHPEAANAVVAEVHEVVGDTPLTAEHVPRLRLTSQVVKEGLRLFPPGWAIAREATRDTTLGGFAVRRKAQIFTVPFLVQRNPAHFREPERFLPERWQDDALKELPRFAYFPFGGGPRVCIGNTFAMTELTVILALLLQAADFSPSGKAPKPIAGFTLRPRGGVPLRIHLR